MADLAQSRSLHDTCRFLPHPEPAEKAPATVPEAGESGGQESRHCGIRLSVFISPSQTECERRRPNQ